MKRRVLFALLAGCCLSAQADPGERYPAEVVRDYHGAHPEDFTREFDRVRTLVHVAQVEVSSRLGLIQYREGFRYPMRVRFQDGSPAGLESALAYVALEQSAKGFQQELVVNVEAVAATETDFDSVFYHEMTHAVMNDAVGGDASQKIPHWAQEGLAMYVSGEGDARVRAAAQQVRRSQAGVLVQDIEGAYSARRYPQYYLAIKYFADTGTINAAQAFVRYLIFGKDVEGAMLEALNMDLATFKKNLADYSLKIYQDEALPDF